MKITKRSPFLRGAISSVPIAASVIPFGVIAAVSANEAGLSALETMALSLIVFAGAAQLAALELVKNDAPALFIIGAAVVVNLRFVMYSAALATKVSSLHPRIRALMSYVLTDQAFALSLPSFDSEPPKHGAYFFLGAALTLWTAWQSATIFGIVLGASVPDELSLDFSVALAFIALVGPHLRSRPSLAAAIVSVGTFLLARGLPYGLALLPAAAAGIIAGMLAERSGPS